MSESWSGYKRSRTVPKSVRRAEVLSRFFIGLGGYGTIIAVVTIFGYLLAVVVGVGVLATPSFRQRIYSGESVSTVRRSFVTSGLLYLAFSAVPAVIGMAAHALNPGLDNSNFAFPYLATQVLPLGVGLIVLLAGLSATMSSASSDAIAGVSILMRDIGYTDLMVDGAPSPHQSDTTLRWLIDRLRS